MMIRGASACANDAVGPVRSSAVPARQTKVMMETRNKIMDLRRGRISFAYVEIKSINSAHQDSQTAGMASMTQTFHTIFVVV